MVKIDLTGKAGWQSKYSDQLKNMESGDYEHKNIVITPEEITSDWLAKGTMVQVEEGEITLKIGGEEMKYETGELIVFNEENTEGTEIIISKKVSLQIFIPK